MYLTFRQLKYFVEVVRAKSIAKAAERLHVSPTALSLQIREMEEQFRVSLLTRHSRGVAATSIGVDLFDRAVQILALVDDASRALSTETREPSLRLGAPPSIARLIGVETMFGASSWLGGVSVEVTEGWTVDLEAQLASGELDAVIGYDLKESTTSVTTHIVDDTFVFIAAPGLAGGNGPISLTDVLKTDLVFYGEESVSYRGVRSAAAIAGLSLSSHHHVYSINVWRSLLTRGRATTIGSVAAVDEEYRHGEIVIREIAGDPIRSSIGVAVRSELATQARLLSFVEFVRGLVTEGIRRDWARMVQQGTTNVDS